LIIGWLDRGLIIEKAVEGSTAVLRRFMILHTVDDRSFAAARDRGALLVIKIRPHMRERTRTKEFPLEKCEKALFRVRSRQGQTKKERITKDVRYQE
jgi:hypothetical protein